MNVRDEQLEQLTAYLDGELDDAGRREVEALLARDPAAKALLGSLRQTAGLVAALPRAAAPRDLAAKIHDRMARSELLGDAGDEPVALARTLVWMNRLAIAACVALICTASWLGLRRSVTQPPVAVALNETRDKNADATYAYKKTPASDERLVESKSGPNAHDDTLAWAEKDGRSNLPTPMVGGPVAGKDGTAGFAIPTPDSAGDVPGIAAKSGRPMGKSGETFGAPGGAAPVQTMRTDVAGDHTPPAQSTDWGASIALVKAGREWGDFERRINETGVSNADIRAAKVDTISNVVVCQADNETVHEQLVRKVADFATGNRIPDAAAERLPEPVQARQPFYYIPRAEDNFAQAPKPNETWVVMQVPEAKVPELMNELKAVAETNRAQVQTEVNACRVDTPEEASRVVAWNNTRNQALYRARNVAPLETVARAEPGAQADHDAETAQSKQVQTESEPARTEGTPLADASGNRTNRDMGRIVSDAVKPARPTEAPKEKAPAKGDAASVAEPSNRAVPPAGGRSNAVVRPAGSVGAAPPPATDRRLGDEGGVAGGKAADGVVEKSARAGDRDDASKQEKTPVGDPAVAKPADGAHQQDAAAPAAKAAPIGGGVGGERAKADPADARAADAGARSDTAQTQTRREVARGKAAPPPGTAAPPPVSAAVPSSKAGARQSADPVNKTGNLGEPVQSGAPAAPGVQTRNGLIGGQPAGQSDNLTTRQGQTSGPPASAGEIQTANRIGGVESQQLVFDDAPAEGCVTLSICIQGPPGTSNALNNLNPANAAPVFGPQLPPTTQSARPVQNAAPPGQTANPGILSPAGQTSAPATSNPAAGARRD